MHKIGEQVKAQRDVSFAAAIFVVMCKRLVRVEWQGLIRCQTVEGSEGLSLMTHE